MRKNSLVANLFPRTSFGLGLCLLSLPFFLFLGCGPKFSYPASTVTDSIQRISLKEYKIPVRASVVGKTLGVLMPLESDGDKQGLLSKEHQEAIGKIRQVATRVALSTDLSLDFIVVAAHTKGSIYGLKIAQYLDDVRRANADALGIEEFMNRAVIEQVNFEKDDNGKEVFLLKEESFENFLAQQIAQRIRLSLLKTDKDVKEEDIFNRAALVDGSYKEMDGKKIIRVSILDLQSENSEKTILDSFKITSKVLQGYRFTNFNALVIQDYLGRKKLEIDLEGVLHYQAKKLTDKQMKAQYLKESESIQEAFRLFGFELPQEKDEEEMLGNVQEPAGP